MKEEEPRSAVLVIGDPLFMNSAPDEGDEMVDSNGGDKQGGDKEEKNLLTG